MAFTDNCDVFGSVHEDGFNNIVNHIQHQRPSLFNYGTIEMLNRKGEFCHPIIAHPSVQRFNNPLITVSPHLPIPGYNGSYGMSYIMQLTKVKIDFHPETINLPPELKPMNEQQFALQASFCVGLGCPEKGFIKEISDSDNGKDDKKGEINQGLPFRKLNCFCLDVFAVLHVERSNGDMRMRLDGFEIVDIEPEGLENGLECYVESILRLSLLPKLKISLNDLVFNIESYVSINPTPISSAVPFNPSIEKDQLSVFINLN